jgi:sporulation protein YlmC with PRC-barrel domain
MQLSKLLGLRVIDAAQHPVGTVVDVRLTIAGDRDDNPPTPRVLGLVISPRTKSSFLGYERSDANAPMMLAAFLRWRHRGTFLAAWEDVARVNPDLVRLRPGYTRYSAVLRRDRS